MDYKNHAVAALVEAPEGIPLIRDPKKPSPSYWKLAGGRSEGEETAEMAAQREIREELGIFIQPEDLKIIYSEDRVSHIFTLFRIKVKSLAGIKGIGNEGEEIKIFSLKQLKNLPDFFPNHRRILINLGLI
ncbi:MAG: hypothetical protein A3I89_02875 [Candidatus Harrisonbacteria bacterium RIFCSPLOWO2_02_FULL_41_11]|uniref:Nudix hydrolase domain-containing protein n=1 Tax=Candidatus Harrisonbacteria bacterium RIFCSPHIGHO2_02_FULL_42_16 TaxID=1798404 RepID=A0A1G1ZGL0_9BACT|nr:MAG: hypothetical protein A3B92_03330 [Candidatus Harrisonbacteria bacterium RIFCSPHIGHO2_02_FULL_42_16]OGY67328.1 MAG: hypothetical protein A3I89_02875 [Candidatus Harrisonbacteria bacterium RIFCSPLOWO2_02_FULL_41_11]